jgi:hypothetical protein
VSRFVGRFDLSVLRLAKLANSTVLRILQMMPKPRLSEFVLRFATSLIDVSAAVFAGNILCL